MVQHDQKDAEVRHGQTQIETRVLPRGSYEERQDNTTTLNNVAQAFNVLNQLQQQSSDQAKSQ